MLSPELAVYITGLGKNLVMKQDMIEMLVYLCENGFTSAIECADDVAEPDEYELSAPPYPDNTEKKIFKILADLPDSQRVFVGSELEHIGPELRSYILLLSNIGVLDHEQREAVIEYLMQIDDPLPNLDDLKWAVIMSLCYEPMQEALDSLPETAFVGDLSEVWH